MAHGPGPLDSDTRIPTFLGDTFISSQARALLENLAASRGDPAERRTLGKEGVEAWLDRFISRYIGNGVNPLLVQPVDPLANGHLQAFIETYFSNYIEGTEFEIEEAHEIVVHGRPLRNREDDSHDILGTYQAILTSNVAPAIPQTFEEFASRLQDWNRQVIESRSAKRPGEFKTENNRAGSTLFVAPDLVLGTLEKGYETIMSAATPESRAVLAAFVVAEVHPFTDGNGRTSRLALNLFLTAAGLTRIIIPTVFRDDCISALKALSSTRHPVPLIRMFARAARFSHWLNLHSKESAFAALGKSNALEEPSAAKLAFGDHDVPSG